MTKYLPFIYDERGYFPNAKCYSMTGEDLKYLTAFFNSKLFKYCFIDNFPTLGEDRRELQKRCFENIPVKKISKEKQKPFENLVDYILFLKETDAAEQAKSSEFALQRVRSAGEARTQNEEHAEAWTQNAVEQFETVIDALVYELYFEEDFEKAEIAFLKYAARDFPAVENLSREEKIKIIHAAYQRLRQKDNEIQTNLKLMDIRLADLIMPIKTAR